MKKINRFKILKIDLKSLVENINNNAKENGRYLISARFSDKIISDEDNYEMIADNGLFFQIYDLKRRRNIGLEIDENYYKRDIIFLDFSNTINYLKSENNYRETVKKLFSDGFILQYDNEKIEYVNFEKSNSMSKKSIVSFLRSDFFEEMKCRINLDIAVKECYISKYYAYKGLLMTPGVRVNNDDFSLNEKKIIVVNDRVENVTLASDYYTAEESFYDKGEARYEIKKISCKNDAKKEAVNFFDGEGLISKEYADILSEAIKEKEDDFKATSFQFRMPFCKGVLHSVDFKKYFKEKNVSEIEDCFGYTHNINDVEIILTLSQFKAYKWFKTFFEHFEDKDLFSGVWQFYWDRYKKYNHGFYVVSVNRNEMNTSNVISLNYQVLNTLKFEQSDFEKLLENSIESYELLKESGNAKLIEILDLKNNNDFSYADDNDEYAYEEDKEISELETENLSSKDIVLEALKKNPALIREKYFKDMLADISKSKIKDYQVGRILAKGKIKLLSGDLLYLLKRLVKEETTSSECLDKNKFYAPCDCYLNDKKYALFRNPHISRNEHVVANAFIAAPESERERYLGHLQGVVMINPEGFYAERLGGADYDGDIVKIVEDEIYIKGAEAGNELELLKIPTIKSEQKEPTVENCFNTIIDTFSNRVGLISDYAFRNGNIAYNSNSLISDEERERYEMNVRELAILTGLEIDSAKNGKRPYLDFNKYKVDAGKDDFDFLALKKEKKKGKGNNKKINIDERNIKEEDSNISVLALKFEKLKKIKATFCKSIKNAPIFNSSEVCVNSDLQNKVIALILASKAVTKNINLKIFYMRNEDENYNEIQIRKILLETHSFDYVEKNMYLYKEAFLHICDKEILRILKKRISEYNWPFVQKEERPFVFKKIIEGYEKYFDNIEDYTIFFDFRKKGYNLLYYSISYAADIIFKEECQNNQASSDKLEKSRKSLKAAIERLGDDSVPAENYIDEFIDLLKDNRDILALKKSFAKITEPEKRLALLKNTIKEQNNDLFNMLSTGLNEKNPFIFKVISYYKEYSAVVDEIGEEYIGYRQAYYNELIECVPEDKRYTKCHIAKVYEAFKNKMIELCGSADMAIKIFIPLVDKYDSNQKLLWNSFAQEAYRSLTRSEFKIPTKAKDGNFVYEIQKYYVDKALEKEGNDND